MFQCYSLKSSFSHWVQKSVLYICVSFVYPEETRIENTSDFCVSVSIRDYDVLKVWPRVLEFHRKGMDICTYYFENLTSLFRNVTFLKTALHTVASESTEQRQATCSNSWSQLPYLCDLPWASWRDWIKWPLSILRFQSWCPNLFAKDSLSPLEWEAHRRVTERLESSREPDLHALLLHLKLDGHTEQAWSSNSQESWKPHSVFPFKSKVSDFPTFCLWDLGRWETQKQQGLGHWLLGANPFREQGSGRIEFGFLNPWDPSALRNRWESWVNWWMHIPP